MTQGEKTANLVGSVRSAIQKLEWYARDFDSSTVKSIANDLKDALDLYQGKRKTL